MGRGRAKAKQTKVARQLKYSSGGTDLDRLQAELASARGDVVDDVAEDEDDDDELGDDYDDPYADAYDDEGDEEPRAGTR